MSIWFWWYEVIIISGIVCIGSLFLFRIWQSQQFSPHPTQIRCTCPIWLFSSYYSFLHASHLVKGNLKSFIYFQEPRNKRIDIWHQQNQLYLSTGIAGPSSSLIKLNIINTIPRRISCCNINCFVQFIHLLIKKTGIQHW